MQTRRNRTLPKALTAVVAAALFTAGCGSGATSAASSRPAQPSSPPDFSLFVGDWHAHGRVMTVSADGSFTMAMRIYKSCDQFPPPCDPNVGSEINDGAQAAGRITSVSGTTVVAEVSTTNDAPLLPSGRLTFTLDTATDVIDTLNLHWCGPRTPGGIC
jgi:hypothetical protein